jgi:outer membrane protein
MCGSEGRLKTGDSRMNHPYFGRLGGGLSDRSAFDPSEGRTYNLIRPDNPLDNRVSARKGIEETGTRRSRESVCASGGSKGTARRACDCAPEAGWVLHDRLRSFTHHMNRTLAFVSALAAGMLTTAGVAQTAGPQAPASAPPAAVAPQAIPAKIALIEYEQVAAATNEGQRALQELQQKYEPRKKQLDALAQEVDSLKKQLQSAPATMSEEERASRARTIEVKEKQLQRDGEDAQTSYSADLQDSVGKIAKKLGPTVMKYVQDNGYTMLLNITGQQGGMEVLWTIPGTDISQAIVDRYNASSGVAALPPAAPSQARPATTPRPPTSTQ